MTSNWTAWPTGVKQAQIPKQTWSAMILGSRPEFCSMVAQWSAGHSCRPVTSYVMVLGQMQLSRERCWVACRAECSVEIWATNARYDWELIFRLGMDNECCRRPAFIQKHPTYTPNTNIIPPPLRRRGLHSWNKPESGHCDCSLLSAEPEVALSWWVAGVGGCAVPGSFQKWCRFEAVCWHGDWTLLPPSLGEDAHRPERPSAVQALPTDGMRPGVLLVLRLTPQGSAASHSSSFKCCSCGRNHTANYRGCVKWKEDLAKRTPVECSKGAVHPVFLRHQRRTEWGHPPSRRT